jgi:RecA-family ATPase
MADERPIKSEIPCIADLWEAGFSIFPLNGSGQPIPSHFESEKSEMDRRIAWYKRPCSGIQWGQYRRDPASWEQVQEWQKQYPKCNWGIATGLKVMAVDCDSPDSIQWVEQGNIQRSPFYVNTANGRHYLYSTRDSETGVIEAGNSVDSERKIDFRGSGGYIVAPGSIHGSGMVYEYSAPEGMTLAELWDNAPSLTKLDLAAVKGGTSERESSPMVEGGIDEGGRNTNLARLIGLWVSENQRVEEIIGRALAENLLNNPPLPVSEVKTTVHSIFKTHILRNDFAPLVENEKYLQPQRIRFSLSDLETAPNKRPIMDGYFPLACTSQLSAAGGSGKSTWMMWWLMSQIEESDTRCLILTAEDEPEDYRRKAHALLNCPEPPTTANKAQNRINIWNVRGKGLKLIEKKNGICYPNLTFAADVIDAIKSDGASVVFVETLSRFIGEEDNEQISAAIACTDHIAQQTNCAVVLIHHTSKASAQGVERGEIEMDQYHGRGGGALADSSRSVLGIQKASSTERRALSGHTPDDSVIVVRHLKNSYGPQRPPAFFANRSGYLRPLSEKTAAEKKNDQMRSEIACKNTLLERMNEIGYVLRRDIERTAQFAKDLGLTRESLRIAVREALASGQLTMVDARKNGKGQTVSVLIAKAGADALARDGYILDV